tara:strand:- start:272 stop:916 length:645 start_codon:yes stop_codon:yes gene_type:complete
MAKHTNSTAMRAAEKWNQKMEYANNLRFLRDATDYNQKAIADQLGIHQAEYGRMENGKRRIGKHLEKLAEILGCTPADIISDTPSAKIPPIDMMSFFALPDEGSGCVRYDQALSTQVERPPVMRGRDNAFCVLSPNMLMEPALKTGDLCFADPDEPLRDDDLCVVVLQAGNRIICCIRKFLGAGVYVSTSSDEEYEYGAELLHSAPILSVIYAR